MDVNEERYISLAKEDPSAAAALFLQKDNEILRLQQQILNDRKYRYGRKSEKLNSIYEQEALFPLEELEEDGKEEESEETVTSVKEHKRKKRSKKEFPKDIPVKTIHHPPIETECSCCKGELTQIREENTKVLNYFPARFELEQHIKPVMVCKGCNNIPPVTTPLPSGIQLIKKSAAGVGLLSHILISKYADHLPLYRLEQIFARSGLEITRQRMCEWLGHLSEILHPLYKELKRELIAQRYLQADETTVKIQDGIIPGKCHTGYFWSILSPPHNLVFYHYAPTRASEVPKSLLANFSGVLQTDLYAGYNVVYLPDDAQRAGCWAHVRRKLINVRKLAPSQDFNKALQLISKLYAIEPKGKKAIAAFSSKSNRDELLAKRQNKSLPIMERLWEHLSSWGQRTLPESDVKKAINYALSQWDSLTLYLTDPQIRIDNNLIENQMRPIALGRKNWLFAGSHEGAMRAAIFYSLINSCRLHNINLWEYFNDVLSRIQSTSKDQLHMLLPHRWKKTGS